MLLKQLMEVYDILDDSKASAEGVAAYLRGIRADHRPVGPPGRTGRTA